MYSYTLPLTSALDGMGGHRHAPATFPPPRKTRHPLYRTLGGSQGQSGRVRKIPPPQRIDLRSVQPQVTRYTQYTIPAHKCKIIII